MLVNYFFIYRSNINSPITLMWFRQVYGSIEYYKGCRYIPGLLVIHKMFVPLLVLLFDCV